MRKISTYAILPVAFSMVVLVAYGQYCTPTYSTGCSAGDFIDGVEFATINNTNTGCNPNGDYIYYSNDTGFVQASQAYGITLTPTTQWNQGMGVWIDFNGNGDFGDPGEFVFSSSPSTSPQTGTIAIPSVPNPPSGHTRMRVLCIFNSEPGANNYCDSFTWGETEDYPMFIIPDTIPPEADFDVSTNYTCSGLVTFYNQTFGNVDTAIWHFGDGTVDTLYSSANITHTYSSNGTYDIYLFVANEYGWDDTLRPGLVTVDFGGGPDTGACVPSSGITCCGAGIYEVSLNNINNTSGDATNGYEDFSCQSATDVYEGDTYPMYVRTDSVSEQWVKAWIDYNNDKVFSMDEEIFDSKSIKDHTGVVWIPGPLDDIRKDTLLRMRVASTVDGGGFPAPAPCAEIEYGQHEDYAVRILDTPFEPEAVFGVNKQMTCTGTVKFIDSTLHAPTSWNWDFGDGNLSTQRNPVHTYTSSGVYTVTLTVENSNGQDVHSKTDYITVQLDSVPRNSVCTPQTVHDNCFSYGIYRVQLEGIDQKSGCGIEGYMDFSCEQQNELMRGWRYYTIDVETSKSDNQDTRVWIDFNDDGKFSANELVGEAMNKKNPSIKFRTPSNVKLNKVLRMRVISDFVGSNPQPCQHPQYGQAEDYGIVLIENPLRPQSMFTANRFEGCPNFVQFTDTSLNVVTDWYWDFGDGFTSTQRHPKHYYAQEGDYEVKLVVSGPFGKDSIIKTAYISISDGEHCVQGEDYKLPAIGTGAPIYACEGRIFDDGGPDRNYSPGTDGNRSITPPAANSIKLIFTTFQFEVTNDALQVHNGPTTGSPLIGSTFHGGNPPPGTIIANSGAATLRQFTNEDIEFIGFAASFTCEGPPKADFTFDPSVTDTCADRIRFINRSTSNTAKWEWFFGNDDTSTQQHPFYEYEAYDDSVFTVMLVASNQYGADTAVKEWKREGPGTYFTSDPKNFVYLSRDDGVVDFYDQSYGENVLGREWNFGTGDTDTSANPVYQYTQSGDYQVRMTVWNEQCTTDYVRTIKVRVAPGVEEVEAEPVFRVYPNPSHGQVQVRYYSEAVSAEVELTVYNLVGQQIYHRKYQNIQQLNEGLNLIDQAAGTYLVRLIDDIGHYSRKVILQK